MGGPKIEALLAVFNDAYEKFVTENLYVGFAPNMLHAKAMAYAVDRLQATYPITRD